tara:strand:- start:216 stop:671 length:456 start_codon:yes stop_codon:yes gene_type:complete
MKILIKLITISFILSSCAVTNTHNLGDLMQNRGYVSLDISDIKNLGETEVSFEYSKYLFLGSRLISLNGEFPDNGVKHYVDLQTSAWDFLGLLSLFEQRYMKRALYKAYIEFPTADYLEITSENIETHKMFLGRKIKRKAIVKAYKYNYAK